MVEFVLIHGAMHGGWCWEQVAPLLQARGHNVHAPDLPGLGQEKTPPAEVTLESWGRFAASCPPPAQSATILVGHSMGGMVISQAAEYAPERIAGLIYVAALLPRNGESPFMLTQRGEDLRNARLELQRSPDGQTVFCRKEDARAAFYNNTPPEWADRALDLLMPQPVAVMAEAAKLTAARFGTVPRAYIECLRDRVLPISLQRQMQAASPCRHVAAINTDHSPFYSTPEILADRLLDCARHCLPL